MRSIVRGAMLAAGIVAAAASIGAAGATASATLPAIASNDNTVAAGRLDHGVLYIALVAGHGMWYPDGPGTTGLPVEGFGEAGKPLQIPGPLVRAPIGTRVVATIRNDLGHELRVRGLTSLTDAGSTAMHIAAGATRTVSFVLDRPGAYGYYGSDTLGGYGDDRSGTINSRIFRDAELSGAIIVDPRQGQRVDHVFVLGMYAPVRLVDGTPNFIDIIYTINGHAFPATERLTYTRGQHIRWAVFNASGMNHPMHLHGFYYHRDAPSAVDEVTHAFRPGEAGELSWTADRAGDWMFHCHIMDHTMMHPPLAKLLTHKPQRDDLSPAAVGERFHLANMPMGGMAIALHVRPRPGDHPAIAASVPRRLTLVIDEHQEAKAPYPDFTRDTLHLTDGERTINSSGNLGPAIVLTQGQPVAIAIENHMSEETSLHWHGIALDDSYYDGGAGMGKRMASAMGMPDGPMRMSPPIKPGSTFVARFAPPDAGTFMYHAHMDDSWQVPAGINGPLIILPPGRSMDPKTDHIVMISESFERAGSPFVAIGGSLKPAPITMTAGVPQRLRFALISLAAENFVISLVDGTHVLSWTPIAKDGRDMPASLRHELTATSAMTIGETRDFTFVPSHAGQLAIQVYDLDNNRMLVATQPIDVSAP